MNYSKKDIQTRQDIEILMHSFYKRVKQDDLIGIFFTEVVPLNWDTHIPLICDFWETTLLNRSVYRGNPMQTHLELHQKKTLQKKHFDRWLKLFNETTDELFAGETAHLAKTRALSIATVIQIKIAGLPSS